MSVIQTQLSLSLPDLLLDETSVAEIQRQKVRTAVYKPGLEIGPRLFSLGNHPDGVTDQVSELAAAVQCSTGPMHIFELLAESMCKTMGFGPVSRVLQDYESNQSKLVANS